MLMNVLPIHAEMAEVVRMELHYIHAVVKMVIQEIIVKQVSISTSLFNYLHIFLIFKFII